MESFAECSCENDRLRLRTPVETVSTALNVRGEGVGLRACPSCSQEAGLTQDDYLEDVVLGEPGGFCRSCHATTQSFCLISPAL